MRHFALICSLVAVALALGGAAPARAASSGVKLVGCESSLDPAGRAATFEARMRAKKAARRMQVRFTLQTRTREEPRWRTLPAAGFGRWLTSDRGVGRYVYTKRVVSLVAPASYRTIVRFRWLDADGDVVKSARVTSAACRQPDMRPDLEVRRIEVLPGGDAATRDYAVVVRNAGRSDADPFAVALRVGDVELGVTAALGLASFTSRVMTFTGPACAAGEPLLVTLDAGEVVDERDESDNAFAATCPG